MAIEAETVYIVPQVLTYGQAAAVAQANPDVTDQHILVQVNHLQVAKVDRIVSMVQTGGGQAAAVAALGLALEAATAVKVVQVQAAVVLLVQALRVLITVLTAVHIQATLQIL
jgi:hypothetical protein